MDYLANKAAAQEKAAHKSGDLISLSLWAPALRGRPAWQEFKQKSLTNSAHFVAWQFSEDDILTGYVRPEEVGFWQSELCAITNSVSWAERRLFELAGKDADCRLPDGSHVGLRQVKEWLDASIAEGWSVGISLVQSDTSSVLVASRRKVGGGSPSIVAPVATEPRR